MTAATTTTHELFIHAVRDIVIAHARAEGVIDEAMLTRLAHAKLVYGIGDGSYRGICYYGAWQNGIGNVELLEIAASAQESWVQLAGTTIHELAHSLASACLSERGHGAGWKNAAVSLGFKVRPHADGRAYHLAMFAPAIRHAIYALAAKIDDGSPAFRTFGLGGLAGLFANVKPRPCSAGVGTKGGKSRGTGSGSRLRLWECECKRPITRKGVVVRYEPVKVRIASDDFRAHCDVCEAPFTRK
jgi:hypothetical protein